MTSAYFNFYAMRQNRFANNMLTLDRSLLLQHSRAFVICYHNYRKCDSEIFFIDVCGWRQLPNE